MDPVQVFYAKDFFFVENSQPACSMFPTKAESAGVKGDVRYTVVPRGKNTFEIRLTNLADVYDKSSRNAKVDLRQLVSQIYTEINAKEPQSVELTELALSGNQELKTMRKNKITWQTEDASPSNKHLNYDSASKYVELEPQRIRVFKVKVVPSAAEFLQ